MDCSFSKKLRLVAKKVTKLLTKSKRAKQTTPTTTTTSNQKAEPMAPTRWMHPSQLKSSEYVDCCQHECDENALNEALEAKLRQLIVEEYAQRRAPLQHAVSLHIHGHLTITPTQHEGTFWTSDADVCWRDSAVSVDSFENFINQRAEEIRA